MAHNYSLARPGRLERPTCGFEVRRSFQLSYGRLLGVSEGTRTLGHMGHNHVLYQLSYTHHNCPYIGAPGATRTPDLRIRSPLLYPTELQAPLYLHWSGREDLNLRPPAPKAGALASLRYAPQSSSYSKGQYDKARFF